MNLGWLNGFALVSETRRVSLPAGASEPLPAVPLPPGRRVPELVSVPVPIIVPPFAPQVPLVRVRPVAAPLRLTVFGPVPASALLPLAFFAFIVMLVIADDILVRVGVAIFMVSSMLLFGVSAVAKDGSESPIASAVPGGQFAPLKP